MDPYLSAFGGFAAAGLGMGPATDLVIKFDQPKGRKKKTDA